MDVIDVSKRIQEQHGDVLAPYPYALYCSYHTTAGYVEERLSARLHHDREAFRKYFRAFGTLFPAGANYRHDQLDERMELTEAQRANEPRNADSHLTYIGAGLQCCVSYANAPDRPVFFVELDGINGELRRQRRSTVIGYRSRNTIHRSELHVPVSQHQIDSVNLRDPRLGLIEILQAEVDRLGIARGWVELSLADDERHAGLTVNEFETLLMRHDLADVLRNPMRFVAEKGRSMLRNPLTIPHRAKQYAKYDLVHIVNEFVDALGLNESLVERILDKFLSVPASRFLRLKRTIRLLVAEVDGKGTIVHGQYQSPILIQWRRAPERLRTVQVGFVALT